MTNENFWAIKAVNDARAYKLAGFNSLWVLAKISTNYRLRGITSEDARNIVSSVYGTRVEIPAGTKVIY